MGKRFNKTKFCAPEKTKEKLKKSFFNFFLFGKSFLIFEEYFKIFQRFGVEGHTEKI